MPHLRVSFCLFAILLACAAGAAAQTSTSRITGTVTDTTGAVVPGAAVTALNEETGISQTQTTTDAGLYSSPSANTRSRSRSPASRPPS